MEVISRTRSGLFDSVAGYTLSDGFRLFGTLPHLPFQRLRVVKQRVFHLEPCVETQSSKANVWESLTPYYGSEDFDGKRMAALVEPGKNVSATNRSSDAA